MSIVKDLALASSGQRKITWARAHMPTLRRIEERFRQERPFAGLRIAISVHLEAKTANLGLVLRTGGAEVFLTGCNPLSTQDDVAAAMAERGVETYGICGISVQQYEALLVETLQCYPHIVIDDGGDLVQLLSGRCSQYAKHVIGGCEETTTGIHRLRARERDGTLPFPMMAVNDAKAKHYYDNKYGTGQSVWDSIMHTTNLITAGKTVVVAGYGWCGSGIALRAKGLGANVIVCEVDPFKALDATMNGFRVMKMSEAAEIGDVFITATGCRDIITSRHFNRMKSGAVLCNAGHFNVEIDVEWLDRNALDQFEQRDNIKGYQLKNGCTLNVVAEGRLVNLAAGNGHPAEIMDMSFAVQALAAEWLVKYRDELETKVYAVPPELDESIGWAKLDALGLKIDRLTPEQFRYLQSAL